MDHNNIVLSAELPCIYPWNSKYLKIEDKHLILCISFMCMLHSNLKVGFQKDWFKDAERLDMLINSCTKL